MNGTQSADAAVNMGAPEPTAAATPQTAAPPSAAPPGMWHPAQGQMFDPRRKSPSLAAVLSVAPGVGQLYIGYYVRGFVVASVFAVAVISAGSVSDPLAPVLGMFSGFLWIFNVIDAGRMAALYNHAASGTDVVELPEDFKLPQMGGSIVGGAVLLVFGGIALSNTAFGYSLAWVEVWWPVFPFALGAYLFVRGIMDHMAKSSDAAPRFEIDDESSAIDD